MNYISLFSGAGGTDLGFEQTNKWNCVLQVEQDRYARQVLKRHWANVPRMEDVRDVTAETIRTVTNGVPIHAIIGGFPCQDCSLANSNRKGLDGERSGLWHEFYRIIREVQPEWFVIENVTGLLSSQGGRDFKHILDSLDNLQVGGQRYVTSWNTLDSQHFGVPQRRKRLFIVGSLGDARSAEVLAIGEGVPGNIKQSRGKGQTPTRDTQECFNPTSPQAERVRTVDGKSCTLGSQGGGMGAKTGLYMVPDTCGTLTSRWYRGFNGQDAYTDHLVPTTYALQENMIGRKHHNGPAGSGVKEEQSFTLTSAGPHGVSVGQTVRRLTPTECCRLQGFPDDWNDWLSDAQRYKQMGNAVTVPVAKWIGERMCQHSGS